MKNSNWFEYHFFLLRRNARFFYATIFLISLLPFFSVLCAAPLPAENIVANNKTLPNKPPVSTNANTGSIIYYCPSPDSLKKRGDYWIGPDGWISYYQSFIQSIDKFIDAHWIGVGVGKIVCRYGSSSLNTPDFPISLENNSQFVLKPEPDPKKNLWGKEIKGVMNCVGATTKDCPFYLAPENNKIDYKNLLSTPDARKSNAPIEGTVY